MFGAQAHRVVGGQPAQPADRAVEGGQLFLGDAVAHEAPPVCVVPRDEPDADRCALAAVKGRPLPPSAPVRPGPPDANRRAGRIDRSHGSHVARTGFPRLHGR
ncbi:hypothetical protein GCM10010297_31380 [Streptomyces malachitofuscus]|nr:hypothetical protein GCM10010297_31380 [Streptomyces malachitofuscus]